MFAVLVLTLLGPALGYLSDPQNPVEVTYFIMSDTNNKILATDERSEQNAVQTWDESSDWTAIIPGAIWIWSDYMVLQPDIDETVTFVNEFYVPGGIVEGFIELAADHSVWVYLNDKETNCFNDQGSFTNFSQFTCDLSNYLTSGNNVLKLVVTNAASSAEDEVNPAGLLYKMMIKSIV